MRAIVLSLLTMAAALRLAGQAGPSVSPKEITLHAGETAVLSGSQHPGSSCGFPYHHDFSSDMPAVASVRGFASGSSACQPDPGLDNGNVYVTAVAPGVAHVRVDGCCGDLSTITVLPAIRPVTISAQATRARLGQSVALTALVAGYSQTPLFFWYRGRTGDFSRPLRISPDPHLTFTTTDPGVSYLWVNAVEGSVTTSAEIGIEFFIEPRRRAAQH